MQGKGNGTLIQYSLNLFRVDPKGLIVLIMLDLN